MDRHWADNGPTLVRQTLNNVCQLLAAYDRCQPFRTGIIMLGVTFGRNHHVWIRIESSIVENSLRLRRTGINLSEVADSGQLIDPLAISVITVVTSELITQYHSEAVLVIPVMETRELSFTLP